MCISYYGLFVVALAIGVPAFAIWNGPRGGL